MLGYEKDRATILTFPIGSRIHILMGKLLLVSVSTFSNMRKMTIAGEPLILYT